MKADSKPSPPLGGASSPGEFNAPSRMFQLIYEELRRVAHQYMRRERPDHSLQPTALVHEAYLRLVRGHRVYAVNRTHFFRLSACAMREVLVEHARARIRLKRGGDRKAVTLIENLAASPLTDEAVVQLNDALADLERLADRTAQVVEMRFFAGMKENEIAEALGVSETTVKREWRFARAWLHKRLNNESHTAS